MNNPGLVEFLCNPRVYPENPKEVTLVQTHISWVFIGDEFVYKVKKPVDFGFLNFTTLEKRHFYVNEEKRLNTRFSPDVYLRVVPISSIDGVFHLGNATNVVDYALKMRRISEEHMLYKLLEKDQVSDSDMRHIGSHVAQVYAKIPSDEKSRVFGGLDTISTNIIENFDQTRKYIGGPVSMETFDAIESWSLAYMKDKADLFAQRLDSGCIKDCHGDLHLQHICLDQGRIFIFDCIEFNERFRFGDVASDVAFLAMDCDYNGYPALAKAFVDAYHQSSVDTTLPDVLTFYKVYRAYVRAKVTSFMLDDTGLEEQVKADAYARAKRYYDLAEEYVRHDN